MPIAFGVRSVSGTDRSTVLARETIFYRRLVEVEARIPMRFRQRRLKRAAAYYGPQIGLVRWPQRRTAGGRRRSHEVSGAMRRPSVDAVEYERMKVRRQVDG